jgi:hypothetical protein
VNPRLEALFNNSSRNRFLLGIVLVLLGLGLLWTTEHTDRLRAMGEDALGGFVLTGSAAKPGPAADGQLVLAVGAPVFSAPASDVQFGVSAVAPALVRKVEMFQWKEVHVGGGHNYELNWYDHPIDSSQFIDPTGHGNPGAFPINAARFDSAGVSVDGFKLDTTLVHMIPGAEPFDPPLDHVPANMAATFQVHDGALVSSDNATRPQVGDLRISWLKVDPAHLSVFARDDHGTLVPTNDPAGDPIAKVLIGRQTITDVLTDAPQPPHLKWVRRILSILLAWAGVAMLLACRGRNDRYLALAAAAVPLAIVALVNWWGVRMPAAIALVFIAVAGAAFAVWRWQLPAGKE